MKILTMKVLNLKIGQPSGVGHREHGSGQHVLVMLRYFRIGLKLRGLLELSGSRTFLVAPLTASTIEPYL